MSKHGSFCNHLQISTNVLLKTKLMTVSRYATTPMVDITALVKKGIRWHMTASLAMVCTRTNSTICQ